MARRYWFASLLLLPLLLMAQHPNDDWAIEAESPLTRVSWQDDSIEMWAPQGLTLWYRPVLHSPAVIEYDAMVVLCDSADRLSDLNCFWMATDPTVADGDLLSTLPSRQGVFARCSTLQLYYMGYGGNYNSTTRFRRYNGQPQPPLLAEYTDPGHLLKANHWYHIRLQCTPDGLVRYDIDGETLVYWHDPQPLTQGRFGFRTTLSHCKLRNFRVVSTK